MRKWRLAVSSADRAPESAPILLQGTITENLLQAAKLGYDAIEVHTRETAQLDYDEIEKIVASSGVKVCMVITGRLNTEGKCSLIDDRPYVVNAAIEGMKQYIDMASKLNADIVIGWVRGNIPQGGNKEYYFNRLAQNLKILAEYGKQKNVKLNIEVINRYEINTFNTAKETVDFIEATNRYESQVANSLEETLQIIQRVQGKMLSILPDTFHMNIEEKDFKEAISICKSKLGYVHIADNTRWYPGSGQIDFKQIVNCLEKVGYTGYLSVECLPCPDKVSAAKNAIDYLNKII